jgi:hypothetical protein
MVEVKRNDESVGELADGITLNVVASLYDINPETERVIVGGVQTDPNAVVALTNCIVEIDAVASAPEPVLEVTESEAEPEVEVETEVEPSGSDMLQKLMVPIATDQSLVGLRAGYIAMYKSSMKIIGGIGLKTNELVIPNSIKKGAQMVLKVYENGRTEIIWCK